MTSPEDMIGKHDRCPNCGTLTVVPRSRPQAVTQQQAGQSETFKPVMNITEMRISPAKIFGVAGIVIGVIACLTLWYPIPYLPTVLIGVIGIASAAMSRVASRRSWKKNVELPFLGVAICGVAIYFSLFSGDRTDATPEPPAEPARPAPAPATRPAPVAPPAAVLPIGVGRQWDDRSLKVLAVKIDYVPLSSVTGNKRSQDKFLMISIEASNTSTRPDQYRQITYITLRGDASSRERTFASLSDANDIFYNRVDFGPDTHPSGGVALSAPLGPGKTIRDILIFELPDASAGPYRLELPLRNLGGVGLAAWEIPESALR
ncbi:MAG: hypothetical protein QGG42_15015 [Phycisphaerae bacterium]|jgi:hypothetical protein|nr:hypothetical protein [Phycisphaerae bacterium]